MRVARWTSILTLGALIAAHSALAAAPLSQERKVRRERTFYNFFDPEGTLVESEFEALAPDFEPWALDTLGGGAFAGQTSSIDDSVPFSLTLAAQGGVSATPGVINIGDIEATAGDSRYTVSLELTEPSTYALSGTLQAFLNLGSIDAGVRLTGPGGLLEESMISSQTTLPVTGAGTLATGTYTFEVWARAAAGSQHGGPGGPTSGNAFGNYNVTLDVAAIDPPVVPALPPLGVLALVLALPAGVLALRRPRR